MEDAAPLVLIWAVVAVGALAAVPFVLRLPGAPPHATGRARTAVDGAIVAVAALMLGAVAGPWRSGAAAEAPWSVAAALALVALASVVAVLATRAQPRCRRDLTRLGGVLVVAAVVQCAAAWVLAAGRPAAWSTPLVVAGLVAAARVAGRARRIPCVEPYGLPSRASVFVPSVPLAVAVVALTAEFVARGGVDRVVAWGACASVVLVIARQILALAENIGFWRELEGEVAARRRALERSEARFRSLVHNASDVIVVTDGTGTVLDVSPSAQRVLGRSPEQVRDQGLAGLVAPDDLPLLLAVMAETGPGIEHARRTDCRLLPVPGLGLPTVEVGVTDLLHDPDVAGIVLNIRDVSERKRLEAQLTDMAFHDALTGLPNRTLFGDRLAHAVDRADEVGAPLVVAFVDVDDFKAVNDTLGHSLGDELLRQVAARLSSGLRPSTTVARLGGDEFALLVEDDDDLHGWGERILHSFRAPFEVDGQLVSVRVSVGLARSGDDADGAEALLRNADLAMYSAKTRGKGCHAAYEPDLHQRIVGRMHLEADLRQAIAGDQLFLEYQPIVDLETGATRGFEALVRWEHPSRGRVPPLEFVPIAERNGSIAELGAWVLRTACAQAAQWQRAHPRSRPLTMSVNLSARQLLAPGVVEEIAAVVEAAMLAPGSLTLEVTEAVLLDESAVVTLGRLRSLGLKLALDDFGTGYSSLSYLGRLPLDTLKIDASFMQGVDVPGSRSSTLTRAVVSIAESLELGTVAEGIETEAERRALVAMGAGLGQGYLFGRPLPVAAAEERLSCETGDELIGEVGPVAVDGPPAAARPVVAVG